MGATMHSETFLSLVKPLEKLRRIGWLTNLVGTVAFAAAVYAYAFLAQPGSGVDALRSNPPTVPPIPLVIVSVAVAVLATIVPRLMMSETRMRRLMSQPPEAFAGDPRMGAAVYKDRLAKIKSLSPDKQHLLALVSGSYSTFPVRLALNQSIAMFGLARALATKSFVVVLPFAVVSFALNLMVPSLLDFAMSRAASLGIGSADAPLQL
jgi:hypothetical protein